LDNRIKVSKNQDADLAKGERSNDGRRQRKGELRLLMADSMIRGLGFKNLILKQEKGKVGQKCLIKVVGWIPLKKTVPSPNMQEFWRRDDRSGVFSTSDHRFSFSARCQRTWNNGVRFAD
jgi:hypothetical protein